MTIDEQLLTRLITKDEKALEMLYDRYYLLVWKVCWRAQPDSIVCEHLVKLVFQQLWLQPREFIGEKKLVLLLINCSKEKIIQIEEKRTHLFRKK